MIRAGLFSVALALGAGAPTIQTPAPDAYRLQFENAWVKVTRVHYEPRQRLAEHQHPGGPNIYVYLNDGGPVLFKHEHGDSGLMAATRPPTKARAYRLAGARQETHIVENQSDLPSDFLEVGLKTDINLKTFAGRHESDMGGASASRVEFDTDQVRVTRITCAAPDPCDSFAASFPTLVIGLSATPAARAGDTQWFESGSAIRYGTDNTSSAEYLMVELKTRPVTSR